MKKGERIYHNPGKWQVVLVADLNPEYNDQLGEICEVKVYKKGTDKVMIEAETYLTKMPNELPTNIGNGFINSYNNGHNFLIWDLQKGKSRDS